jgi:hypothetical protein
LEQRLELFLCGVEWKATHIRLIGHRASLLFPAVSSGLLGILASSAFIWTSRQKPSESLITAARTRGLAAEAVAAVDWAVVARFKRDLSLLAAFGTDCGAHLAREGAASTTAIAALITTRPPAARTALGLAMTFFSVERLILGTEGERAATVLASEIPALVAHG